MKTTEGTEEDDHEPHELVPSERTRTQEFRTEYTEFGCPTDSFTEYMEEKLDKTIIY